MKVKITIQPEIKRPRPGGREEGRMAGRDKNIPRRQDTSRAAALAPLSLEESGVLSGLKIGKIRCFKRFTESLANR